MDPEPVRFGVRLWVDITVAENARSNPSTSNHQMQHGEEASTRQQSANSLPAEVCIACEVPLESGSQYCTVCGSSVETPNEVSKYEKWKDKLEKLVDMGFSNLEQNIQ